MGQQRKRYRVGIDVGLYSVGLAAIEIDDSSDDPRDALPIDFLSCMSVIHDGGVDSENAKEADSRKKVSGIARRTRKMRKRERQRLKELDEVLSELGYPVHQAKAIAEGAQNLVDGNDNALSAWNARIYAVENYIENDAERLLTITVALRHIARHRGWRNPYSSVESLKKASEQASKFYEERFSRIEEWKFKQRHHISGALDGLAFFKDNLDAFDSNAENVDALFKRYEGVSFALDEKNNLVVNLPENLATRWDRPTPAQLVELFLNADSNSPRVESVRFRRDYEQDPKTKEFKPNNSNGVATQIGKLHQSDYYHEITRIFETQKVPNEHREKLLQAIFKQINPRDVGAAAELVAKDDLPGQEKYPRASRSSLAFQKFRILDTITNLRIRRDGQSHSELSVEEVQTLFDYLTTQGNEETTWHDVAAQLGIERNDLIGVGGQTFEGEPISAKKPPVLNSEIEIRKAAKKELSALGDWWDSASAIEKDCFIETLDNAGASSQGLDEQTLQAKENVEQFIQGLSDEALQALETISLLSGRAAYSTNSLNRLSARMLKEGVGLHTARKEEFGVDDSWRPSPKPLGTPTGNPAVDRTIKIVTRWLKACNKRWGAPETINIEHVRDGFVSPKKAMEDQRVRDKAYKANQSIREEIVAALDEQEGSGVRGAQSIRHADIRRYQAVQRQNCQCIYCGKKITFETAQMDHIVPRKGPGSSNDLPNLVASCADCNKSKSNTLFYTWAKSKEKRQEVLDRVDTWNQDSYFSNKKQFKSYINDVKRRLRQKEEDDPIDARSIESVAWMARELREQIEGYFGYQGSVTASTDGNNDFTLSRVNVYRGSLTAEARKASGIEGALPWAGGNVAKTRLDRRHHAVDASVIAMMRPGVGKVLAEREALRREWLDTSNADSDDFEQYGFWEEYKGIEHDSVLYEHWRDVQMARLKDVLCDAMNNDKIAVTNNLRLQLGRGRAHEDTIHKMLKRKVGDALTPVNIDKAETPALWLALTRHPDYDPEEGLPEDWNRRIRIHDKWLDANDEIGFLAESEADFDKVKDAVYAPVRGGFAAIGNAIHHARFYRIPKVNKRGKQTGWQYAYLRVFQIDLLKHTKEDLFNVELPLQSYSCRAAIPGLRRALAEGTAEYLGWTVIGDEIEINSEDPYFSPEGTSAINLFMRVFPETNKFKVAGLGTNSQFKLTPTMMALEGFTDKVKEKILKEPEFDEATIKAIGAVLGEGGGFHPSVDVLLSTHPTFIRRNALGEVRWTSNNHMPVSWKVPPHPPLD